MKLITFIGTGKYEEVCYHYDTEYRCTTKNASAALTEWFAPAEVIIMLTAKAAQHDNWRDLENYLQSNQVPYQPVKIPDGQSETEIWQLFSIFAEKLSERDEVILDITHGFRSLPVLALLATIYLRASKKINLRGIFYGAFEAKTKKAKPRFST